MPDRRTGFKPKRCKVIVGQNSKGKIFCGMRLSPEGKCPEHG